MQKVYKLLIVFTLLFASSQMKALEQTGSDSRIKTLVYGQNDVFRINSVYGFQTVVELDPNEKILTISVGNPNIFRIIPSGSRLFVKALINDQITNMTIVTDLRTYQFELESSSQSPEDMMYVARFVYPDSVAADESNNSQPMSLYSPIKLGVPVKPAAMTAPNMPNFSGVPSVSQMVGLPNGGSITTAEPNIPLSIQINNGGENNPMSIPEINIKNQ